MNRTSTSLEQSEGMLRKRTPSPEKPWIENYAILLRSNVDGQAGDAIAKSRMIGVVGAPRMGPTGGEIAYGLHPDFWGKGYATEALKMFIGIYWGPGSEFKYHSFRSHDSFKLLSLSLLTIFQSIHTMGKTDFRVGEASRETLIAEIDPHNKPSERVVEKAGFKRGELLKDCYQRASEVQAGVIKKRDQRRWYLHRPVEGLWDRYNIGQVTRVTE